MKLLKTCEIQSMQLELMKKLHATFQELQIPYYLIAGSALGAVRHQGFIPWDDDIDVGLLREDYERFLSVAASVEALSDYQTVNYRTAKRCDFGLTRIYFPNTRIDDPSTSRTKLDSRLYLDIFPLDTVPADRGARDAYEKKIRKKKALVQRIDLRNYDNKPHVLLCKKVISLCLTPFRQGILRSFDRLMRKYEGEDTGLVCSLCSQYSFQKQVMRREIYGTPVLRRFEDTEFFVPERLDEYLTTLYGKNYMEIPPVEKRRKGHDIYRTNEE